MKKIFIYLFFISSVCTQLHADNRWQNYYGIAWRDTPANHMRYAKSVGYNYINISFWRTPSQYLTDPNASNLKFYFMDPWSLYGLFSEVSPHVRRIDENDSFSSYQKNWFETNMVWKGTSTFPQNLASGVMSSITSYDVMWDFQQQAVITKVITGIMAEAQSFDDPSVPFTFGGVRFDEPEMMGHFWRWDSGQGKAVTTNLLYWLGTNSALLHGTITHEYPTYSDGLAAFYKQLRGSMTASFPGSKWLIEPYLIYDSTANADEWVSTVSQRADKNELIPDMLMQEDTGVEFYTNSNIFNSGMAIFRNMVGSSQPREYAECWNRKYAVKAGIGGSWYHWAALFGESGDMPNFQAVTEVDPRLKLIRLIPNWDNIILEELSTATTRFEGSDFGTASYSSVDTSRGNRMNSYINMHTIWGRNPDNLNRIFAAFGTNSTMGTITLSSNETYENAWLVNGYYEKAATATNNFVFNNSTKILSLAGTVSVDAGSWTGYIIETGTVSAVNASLEHTYSGSMNYAMVNSSVPDVLDGLVLHVPLRDTSMSYAQDVSPYKAYGTISGAVWGTGTRGLYFDGINDRVNFGDPADGHLDFGTGSFSIATWVRPLTLDNTSRIFLAKADTGNYAGGYTLWVNNLNKFRFQINTTSITSSEYDSTTILDTGTWYHLALVVNQSSFPNTKGKCYENGLQVGTTGNFLGTGTTNNSLNLILGALPTLTNYTNCYLRDIRVYDRALSDNEVWRVYTATKQ